MYAHPIKKLVAVVFDSSPMELTYVVLVSLTRVTFCILCNLEINKNSVPSAGAVDMFASQVANNPAVPQPAQMSQGVSRSDLLSGNNSAKKPIFQ